MASTTAPIAQVTAVDHIVLTVADIEATKRFYATVLGMKPETFTTPKEPSVQRHALSFGSQKINLHLAGHEFEPKAQKVQTGSGDLCFLTDDPIDAVLQKLQDANVQVLEGGQVVGRKGARGQLRSVYVRDPDGNLVEISNYA